MADESAMNFQGEGVFFPIFLKLFCELGANVAEHVATP
jgi:hypothetical protein